MKLKQVKKYDKYKTKTANFYEYIFHTLNDDGSEMSVEIKKDFYKQGLEFIEEYTAQGVLF